jgi:hypothetical protein
VVLAALKHAIIAASITVLQVAVTLENIVAEFAMVFELSGPKGPPATLALLILALELMLLAELSAFSVVLAL